MNDKLKIFLAIFASILVAWTVYKLLQKLNIVDDEKDIEAEKVSTQFEKYFNRNNWPEYSKQWRKGKITALALQPTERLKLAKLFQDSLGDYNDDEETIYSVFRALKDLTSITALADTYYTKYGYDLLATLRDRLSNDEMAVIYNILKNKPEFSK